MATDQPDGFNIRHLGEILKTFFLRRPTKEELYKRGIMRNEPVFGSNLQELQQKSGQNIPEFVLKSIEIIEKDDNIISEGLYR